MFDPFEGGGATALEAIRLGRRTVGLDASPVAALIGRVKTARVAEEAKTEPHLLHAAIRAFLTSMPKDPTDIVRKYGLPAACLCCALGPRCGCAWPLSLGVASHLPPGAGVCGRKRTVSVHKDANTSR